MQGHIAEARKRLTLAAEYNGDELLGTALTRLNDLYSRCIRQQNEAKALDVEREIIRLTGLYRQPSLASIDPADIRQCRMTIYTLGYSGWKIEEIQAELDRLDAVLADVRMVPRSRAPIWNGSTLHQCLAEWYIWLKQFRNRNYKGGAGARRHPRRRCIGTLTFQARGRGSPPRRRYGITHFCGGGNMTTSSQ